MCVKTYPRIQRNGISHLCLLYLKAFKSRENISEADIKSFFSHKIDRESRVFRALEGLSASGLVYYKNGWHISSEGVDFLMRMAKEGSKNIND